MFLYIFFSGGKIATAKRYNYEIVAFAFSVVKSQFYLLKYFVCIIINKQASQHVWHTRCKVTRCISISTFLPEETIALLFKSPSLRSGVNSDRAQPPYSRSVYCQYSYWSATWRLQLSQQGISGLGFTRHRCFYPRAYISISIKQIEITLAKMIESRRFLTFMRWIKLLSAGKRSIKCIKEPWT